MKATFTKALLGLALIAVGSAVGTASAHERDLPRVEKPKVHYEHRGWNRYDRHDRFDHDRRFFHHRHHRRFYRDHDDHGRFGRDRGHRG